MDRVKVLLLDLLRSVDVVREAGMTVFILWAWAVIGAVVTHTGPWPALIQSIAESGSLIVSAVSLAMRFRPKRVTHEG